MTDIKTMVDNVSYQLSKFVNAEVERQLRITHPDAAKLVDQLIAERARSANLINALKNLRHEGHAVRFITAVLETYEASRD